MSANHFINLTQFTLHALFGNNNIYYSFIASLHLPKSIIFSIDHFRNISSNFQVLFMYNSCINSHIFPVNLHILDIGRMQTTTKTCLNSQLEYVLRIKMGGCGGSECVSPLCLNLTLLKYN